MDKLIAIAKVVIKEMFRRKDFYVLFVLTALITLAMGSVRFFNDDRIAGYVKELCLLLIWISALVIAMTVTARQLPAEQENRTIFPLLAKPVTRSQVVLGKFLGCWTAVGMALIVFYVFFAILSGAREHAFAGAICLQALWLHWMMLGIVIAMVLLGSVVFAAPSSNVTICLVICVGILLIGRHLNTVALRLNDPVRSILQVVYFSIPHLEFYDVRELVTYGKPAIRIGAMLLATLYAWLYTAFFLYAACLAYKKKALNR